MIEVNLETVVKWAEAEVEKRGGDYNYQSEPLYKKQGSCVNVLFDYDEDAEEHQAPDWHTRDNAQSIFTKIGKKNFRPGCIVGSIVTTNLVDQDWIFEKNVNGAGVGELAFALNIDDKAGFTSTATRFMRGAQAAQDGGKTWSEALMCGWERVFKAYSNREFCGETDMDFAFSIFGQPRPREEWEEYLKSDEHKEYLARNRW